MCTRLNGTANCSTTHPPPDDAFSQPPCNLLCEFLTCLVFLSIDSLHLCDLLDAPPFGRQAATLCAQQGAAEHGRCKACVADHCCARTRSLNGITPYHQASLSHSFRELMRGDDGHGSSSCSMWRARDTMHGTCSLLWRSCTPPQLQWKPVARSSCSHGLHNPAR